MPHPISRHYIPLLTFVMILALSGAPLADVLIRERTVTTGYQGLGAGETVSTIVISGDMRRTESRFTPSGEEFPLEDLEPPSVDIIRLDRQVMWRLQPELKRYSELSFDDLRSSAFLTSAGIAESIQQAGAGGNEILTFDFKLEVQNPGDTAPINEFQTDRTVIRLVGTPEQAEARDQMGEITITVDLWIALEVPGKEELRAFEHGYTSAVGVDPSLMAAGNNAPSHFNGGLALITQEVIRLDGYPIRSILTIESSRGAGDRDSIAGWKVNAPSSRPAGDRFLSNFAGKHFVKKQDAVIEPAYPRAGTQLLRVTREVLAIHTSGLNPGSFEVPQDFEKAE